jgi:hypothetical protein
MTFVARKAAGSARDGEFGAMIILNRGKASIAGWWQLPFRRYVRQFMMNRHGAVTASTLVGVTEDRLFNRRVVLRRCDPQQSDCR